MGKTLHNRIHLGRKHVFAAPHLVAAALALAVLAFGIAALR